MIPGVENQREEDDRKAKVLMRHEDQVDHRTGGEVAFSVPMGPVTVAESEAREGDTNTTAGVGRGPRPSGRSGAGTTVVSPRDGRLGTDG